jgi:hypothetical protein
MQKSKNDRIGKILNDFQRIPEGRELVKLLLEYSNFGRNSYVQGDPYQTAFNCGRQSLGNMINSQLNKQMEKEAEDV